MCHYQHITPFRGVTPLRTAMKRVWERRSHSPGDIGCVLFGLHSQNSDAGGPSFKFRLALKHCVPIGGWSQERIRKEVVEGDMIDAKLVLLVVGKAHVTVFRGSWGVGVRRGYTRGGTSRDHAGRHHWATRGLRRPQIVGNLYSVRKEKYFKTQKLLHSTLLKGSSSVLQYMEKSFLKHLYGQSEHFNCSLQFSTWLLLCVPG